MQLGQRLLAPYSVVHFEAKRSFRKTVYRFWQMSISLNDKSFKICSSALHDKPCLTKRSFISSAICHYEWRILARSLRTANSNLVSATNGECCHTLVPQALCSIEFLAHVTFTCIGWMLSYPLKEFLILSLHQVETAPAPQVRVPATMACERWVLKVRFTRSG